MSVFVDIEKNLGAFHLRVRFEAGNEVIALLGASGCGKSMTLKCIAGVMHPDRGKLVVDDVTLFDSEKRINLSPQARRTGLMFQNYALFPNMTVQQNIKAGTMREDQSRRKERVEEVMSLFGLTELAHHLPSQLSGGQQQRTALARILVSGPSILLLDEPFSALDSHLRFCLEQEVRRVIRRFGKTVIFVSHNRDEVYRLADRMAVMDDGRIVMSGKKEDVFRHPGTRHAAVLTGCKNISRCRSCPDGRVEAVDWGMTLVPEKARPEVGYVGIRMHDIRSRDAAEDAVNVFECEVIDTQENPFSYTIMLRPEGNPEAVPIGWELSKAEWNRLRAKKVTIQLPAGRLLMLE